MTRVYNTALAREALDGSPRGHGHTAVQMLIDNKLTRRHFLPIMCAHSPRRNFMACAPSSLYLTIVTVVGFIWLLIKQPAYIHETRSYRQ